MGNIVFGLVALALGLWGLSTWWWSVTELLRGLVPLVLILIGPIALGAGITRLRERGEMETAIALSGEVDTPPLGESISDEMELPKREIQDEMELPEPDEK